MSNYYVVRFVFIVFAAAVIWLGSAELHSVRAQKSLPLDEQSQQVTRVGDVIQISSQSRASAGENANSSSTTLSAADSTASRSASTSALTTSPPGFAPDLSTYLNWVLSAVIAIALLLAFFNFIQAGFEWITSGGDKGKTDTARQRITNAVIGIIILAASYAVAQFVAYLLGFESLNDALNNIRRIN